MSGPIAQRMMSPSSILASLREKVFAFPMMSSNTERGDTDEIVGPLGDGEDLIDEYERLQQAVEVTQVDVVHQFTLQSGAYYTQGIAANEDVMVDLWEWR